MTTGRLIKIVGRLERALFILFFFIILLLLLFLISARIEQRRLIINLVLLDWLELFFEIDHLLIDQVEPLLEAICQRTHYFILLMGLILVHISVGEAYCLQFYSDCASQIIQAIIEHIRVSFV